VCGPMEYSAIRLNLSQAFNGIGKIVGPLIASDTFFRSGNGRDLSSIQWVFITVINTDIYRFIWLSQYSSGLWL
jgi:MFS transporter, FHS family, L-fucose permease